MRKISLITGLALALTIGAAGVSAAQAPDRPQGEQQGRRGGPEGVLLRGITLTADQQSRIQALQQQDRQNGGGRAEGGMRERGDTTGMGARRAQREARVNAIREILDANQREQFDKNVAEMRSRGGRRPDGQGERTQE